MSHDGHGDGATEMPGMKMWFHFGKNEIVLFEFWKTQNTWVFILTLCIVFAMAFAYEALKYWRDRMYSSQLERARSSLQVRGSPTIKSQVLSGFHIAQTLLHMFQFVLSYFLMLIYMTYNVWLAFAVTLGAGAGYFCFGWYKTSAWDISEHCQ